MSIIDGRIVTLADLPACIGHAPATGRGKGRLLRMPGREKIAGFMVSGDIDSRAIPPEAMLSMPDHLKTAVFDTCVVLDAVPVPVINLSLLYDQMLKPEHEPPVDGLQLTGIEPLDVSSVDRVRLFEIGGELYAAPAAGIAAESAKPGPISRFSSLPQYVMGLTFINGQLLPVIDLQQRQGTEVRCAALSSRGDRRTGVRASHRR
jgi:chemotaxis signal transduction protein